MTATLEDKDLHYLINCVLNTFLCFTASTLNCITIHALRKASSLPKPLRTLLFSLAVSDVGVGFLAQPLYTALLGIAWFQGTKNNPNYDNVYRAFITTFFFFFYRVLHGRNNSSTRQIPSHSPPSQISWVGHSRTPTRCGDLKLAFRRAARFLLVSES